MLESRLDLIGEEAGLSEKKTGEEYQPSESGADSPKNKNSSGPEMNKLAAAIRDAWRHVGD